MYCVFFAKWSPDQHLLRAGQRREVRQDARLESFHELDEIRLGRDLAGVEAPCDRPEVAVQDLVKARQARRRQLVRALGGGSAAILGC